MIVCVIGRGHSGTRALVNLLMASDFDSGSVNESGDLVPRGKPLDIYRWSSEFGQQVRFKRKWEWDFSDAFISSPPISFHRSYDKYLDKIINYSMSNKVWKLPESLFVFPWLIKVYPQFKYIYLIRDPRDCVLKEHLTDDLSYFNVPIEVDSRFTARIEEERGNVRVKGTSSVYQRAVSWKYQFDLIEKSPKPPNFLTVRFEDLILHFNSTLKRISKFLVVPLKGIPIYKEAVGRWKSTDENLECVYDITRDCGYY